MRGLHDILPPQARLRLRYALNRVRRRFVRPPYRAVLPYTMIGLPRLRALVDLMGRLDSARIPGDVVECGTCNGGSGALLARCALDSPVSRTVYLLDSFAGLPAPGEVDGPGAREWAGQCRASVATVRRALRESGVPEGGVRLVEGWFQDTIPGLPVERIALLHVDADWYESVRLVLDRLYDKVVPGGFVVLDDYGYWSGCRRAVLEFLEHRALEVTPTEVDGISAWIQKPLPPR